jgi:cytochrome d ubiquinol oxidase subunit II
MSWIELQPVIFMALMGTAMLVYVILDGFDLGVGLLLPRASGQQKDRMIASIGPFWDANETWLVLGVGILLVAFPKAHGQILSTLYLPVAAMLIGLVLRGVAFDFRVKAQDAQRRWWNRAFFAGSGLAALAQGWMLGRYITGFAEGAAFLAFAACIGLCLAAAYVLLGATWLILKTDGELQELAVRWARQAWPPVAAGMVLISLATPAVSATVRDRWFTLPEFIALLPIPLATAGALAAVRWLLGQPAVRGRFCGLPFVLVATIFVLGTVGLAYSLYPFVIIDRLTIWQAAAAPESLTVILAGCLVTVPAIIGYSVFVYRVFGGKATLLNYG